MFSITRLALVLSVVGSAFSAPWENMIQGVRVEEPNLRAGINHAGVTASFLLPPAATPIAVANAIAASASASDTGDSSASTSSAAPSAATGGALSTASLNMALVGSVGLAVIHLL